MVAVLLKAYRPAGNAISLIQKPFSADRFSGYEFRFYQSGTASLAAALLACLKLSGKQARHAEVILPAYACPDLISAIRYTGCRPVLVDLDTDSTKMSQAQLIASVTSNTLAIIAINFMGIPDRVDAIRSLCDEHQLFFIHDTAQWFPLSGQQQQWTGDFNIISFGRGKPVNLLHGGAVTTANPDYAQALIDIPSAKSSSSENFKSLLKILVYNFAIQPLSYGVMMRLPGLNLGATVYKPLLSIGVMNKFHQRIIEANIQRYQRQHRINSFIRKRLEQIDSKQLIDLVPDSFNLEQTALLRYPLLIKNKSLRNAFYNQTRQQGVSLLYQRPLNQIEGLEQILDSRQLFPNAQAFSQCLLTLPTHEDVDQAHIDRLLSRLELLLRDNNNRPD